jgi:AbiV family abortive infection protein
MKGSQYNKQLNIKRAVEGINIANRNAKSLYEDAKLLFENERYARAISLSILSIEESGKPSILRSILLEEDDKEILKLWKAYRRHYDKNSMWIVPELIANGAVHFNDMYKIIDTESSHSETLDNLKQLCFYTDVFSKAKWSFPENIASEELSGKILSIARINLNDDLFNTEESLKFWVKNMKPVWKKDMQLMKLALIKCYEECEADGLFEPGTSQKMVNFLL